MTIDNGPHPNVFDLESATKQNDTYRTVAWSGKYLQVTLMSIPVGASIGLEAQELVGLGVRLDAGRGLVKMGPSKHDLPIQEEVSDGWSIQVPAGTWHDVENIGDEPMRLYVVYAPVHHAAGIVQETKGEADRDEESGVDEPPAWAVEPEEGQPDEHA